MSLKDLLSPFYVWKRAFEKPYTDKKPLQDRPGAERYRGFHKNDQEKCVGCGTCEAICQNAAIDMVPVKNIETGLHDSGLRPRIDYGRCCWCSLCVDICPSGSLSMSNEYIWADPDSESFRFIPGVDSKPWEKKEKGYKRSKGYGLLNYSRIGMKTLPLDQSLNSFLEIVKGYSREEAKAEAMRCVDCGLCVASCPAHMDIPDYIQAIREDDLSKALKLLYLTNPLPATCGRICTHNCEEVCALGVLGEPIAIRWLKRYIVDQIDKNQYNHILGEKFESRKEKIAIIGAGPAGLSAAYYLVTLGYKIKIFEATDKAGGMIRWGVPEYRMPADQLDKEVEYIINLGVQIEYKTKVGKDIAFREIYAEYDAIFISIGMNIPYKMEIPGEENPSVLPGLDFLDAVARDKKPVLGKSVAVIGGGNVAMDAARTARRLGSKVTVFYRRRKKDMPADQEEIEEAQAEQIEIITQTIPVKIEQSEDEKLLFTWNKAKMVDQGLGKRPKPIPIPKDVQTGKFDSVIPAIGQGPDYSFLTEDFLERIQFKRYKLRINRFGQTTDLKVFAGGDITNEKADAISAIADGYMVARGIDRFLTNKKQ